RAATASARRCGAGRSSQTKPWAGSSGTPVASGRAQGPAFVAQDPHAALAMPAGAILVAPSTDPAWTPLFLRAGAVVMEAGGYLSHGAIVAREFGIPAVVNVQGILRQVASGDWLEVDAARGTVRRLPAPASAATPDGGPPRPRQP
ncbi:PEP-utilizing enzyme, partial [Achromobacter xylosoxidans]|uniref:PEP-utilizing enzyme n=1 Tax=Alcaligenes xylosoxydans xylosoxydans TaxID=85698 RepID=UPI00203D42B7